MNEENASTDPLEHEESRGVEEIGAAQDSLPEVNNKYPNEERTSEALIEEEAVVEEETTIEVKPKQPPLTELNAMHINGHAARKVVARRAFILALIKKEEALLEETL